MSVQTEIDRISTAVQNAHLKVIEKGGTSAAPYLVANLESAIDTIPDATAGEDVTAETNTYTELLTDLEAAVDALPDAGSGGASVETCTLSTGDSHAQATNIACTILENGAMTARLFENVTEPGMLVTDALVKGTCLTVHHGFNVFDGLTKIEQVNGYGTVVYQVDGDATGSAYPCFARDTLILLADGTTKLVQDITYNDLLLVWDFDNGCYAAAYPLWVKQEQTANYHYRCTFDNGAVLRLVGSNGKCHRVFSVDRNMFESATECVGERIMTNNGVARLVSCERIEEAVDFYNIITDMHINLYAEGVLTSCRLNNLYPIEDMRFVKDGREQIPLDAYNSVDADFYRGLRLAEQKPENVDMLNGYVANLYRLKKEVNP